MPNIVEYNSTADLAPSDKGIQAAEVAGRRLGSFGSEIGSQIKQIGQLVERHMAVMETSELYKTGTELRLNLQQRYDQESALPENRGDPHFGDRFMAEVGPLLDHWGSGAATEHGKELAATLKANIRNETFNHVAAGQSAMDTAHVEDNLTQTINTLGAGLLTDPSEANLGRTLDTARTTIQGVTMNIPDVRVREEVASHLTAERLPQLVMARYQGVAESIKQQVGQTNSADQSPAYAQLGKDIAGQLGFQYLPPEAQERVSEMRDAAVRQGQELYKANDAAARKKDSDDFDAALLPIETAMFKSNGAGGVTMVVSPQGLDAVQRAAAMPGARQHPERITSLLNAMHTATQDQIAGKETTTDSSTYLGFTGRIGSTTDPLTKAEVDATRGKGLVSDSDWHFLREAAADSKQANPKINHAMTELNRWLDRIKPVIDKSDIYSGIDQAGSANFSYFAQDSMAAFRKAIASGLDPEKAVESLTDPHNPNGLYSHMQPYMRTNKQGMAGVLKATQPGGGGISTLPAVPGGIRHDTAPAQAGESPSAYLKRIGQ